jgi:triacylglycerol lipase
MQLRTPIISLFVSTCALAATGCGGPETAQSQQALETTCRRAPYPIILAHGMAGWERIGPINYFFQVAADLRARGETVIESQVPPFASSAKRAAYLAGFVDEALSDSGACKVNIIAHSQGGLDARYLISSMGYGDRVGALMTVSTPHRGSPVADVALGLLPGFSYDVINAILGTLWSATIPPGDPRLQESLTQLSRPNMRDKFNPANLDDRRVKYYSVAGRSFGRSGTSECADGVWSNSWRVDVLDPLLAVTDPVFVLTSPNPLLPIINDGLVTIDSARWGTFLGCVPADHLDEIGQIGDLYPDLISGFDHKDLYRRLVAELHHAGL